MQISPNCCFQHAINKGELQEGTLAVIPSLGKVVEQNIWEYCYLLWCPPPAASSHGVV